MDIDGLEFVDDTGKSAIMVQVLRVQVHCLEHILQNVCNNWGISPVMLTLTFG